MPGGLPHLAGAGGVVGGRAEIGAAIPTNAFAQVTFVYRPVGTTAWTPLGTDDNAPYRVFQDVTGIAKGTLLEYRAVAKDIAGNVSAASSYGIVGDAAAHRRRRARPVGPVTQPDNVSRPRHHNTEMGCAGDWQPDCAQAQLDAGRPRTRSGRAPTDRSRPATTPTRPRSTRRWDENYGAGGAQGRRQHHLHRARRQR